MKKKSDFYIFYKTIEYINVMLVLVLKKKSYVTNKISRALQMIIEENFHLLVKIIDLRQLYI